MGWVFYLHCLFGVCLPFWQGCFKRNNQPTRLSITQTSRLSWVRIAAVNFIIQLKGPTLDIVSQLHDPLIEPEGYMIPVVEMLHILAVSTAGIRK